MPAHMSFHSPVWFNLAINWHYINSTKLTTLQQYTSNTKRKKTLLHSKQYINKTVTLQKQKILSKNAN